ncbi:MAG: type I secretion system permease/ATPase [Rhodospirillales bacterium]|nr:type I secretion system permease/ATPase [Alphaproteobacteria bacterium]USO02844.1 MAG: type I secretion system permease/ATPase [Rhodospirillales bacterium]
MSKIDASSIDPLLECLVFLTSHFGRAKSAPALTAGLAYGEKNMGPELFCEAAEKINLNVRVVKRKKPVKIPAPVLPSVLILEKDQACVLLGVSKDRKKAHIWSPETRALRDVSMADLEKSYSGYAIFVHPKPEFSDPDAPHLEDSDRHWFWGPISEAKSIYMRVALAAVLINLFGLTSPLFIMNVYDRVIPNNAIETGWVLALGALTVFLFDFIMRSLRGYFIDLAGRRVDVIAARRIYDHLLNMKLADRPASSGSFANMLRDFDSVRDFYTSATLTAVVDLPFTFFFLFVIWLIGGPVALLLFALIVIVFVTGLALQFPLKALVRKSTKSSEAKHGLLVESIYGLETIKATGADGRLRARYGGYVAENAGYAQGSRFVSGMGVNAATFLQQIASILIVLIGMYLVKDHVLTVGGLIACVLLGGRAITPIGQVANLMSRYHTAKGALKTLNGIMGKPVDRPPHKHFLHRPDLKGQISFQKVSFAYPGTKGKALDEVSFSIQAGEKVGVIGRIGSGKSTIARLMMGLYDPAGGTILFDETDYQQIDPADLRRNIAYIAQDVVLFSGSIRDNITASAPHASEAEILEVAKAAGVHDFISRHPMGYDAPVGERGEGLSGGQRQCVALARAMLLKPNIYICDEPTNAMDMQAEAVFTRHIQEQTKDKTLVLITHRHHLLTLVERLILIDQGKVVADGPRDKVIEVLSKGGIEVPKE